MCVCVCVCVRACVRVCVCVHACLYMYMHIYVDQVTQTVFHFETQCNATLCVVDIIINTAIWSL